MQIQQWLQFLGDGNSEDPQLYVEGKNVDSGETKMPQKQNKLNNIRNPTKTTSTTKQKQNKKKKQ